MYCKYAKSAAEKCVWLWWEGCKWKLEWGPSHCDLKIVKALGILKAIICNHLSEIQIKKKLIDRSFALSSLKRFWNKTKSNYFWSDSIRMTKNWLNTITNWRLISCSALTVCVVVLGKKILHYERESDQLWALLSTIDQLTVSSSKKNRPEFIKILVDIYTKYIW